MSSLRQWLRVAEPLPVPPPCCVVWSRLAAWQQGVLLPRLQLETQAQGPSCVCGELAALLGGGRLFHNVNIQVSVVAPAFAPRVLHLFLHCTIAPFIERSTINSSSNHSLLARKDPQ
jgi:hypothetical protein